MEVVREPEVYYLSGTLLREVKAPTFGERSCADVVADEIASLVGREMYEEVTVLSRRVLSNGGTPHELRVVDAAILGRFTGVLLCDRCGIAFEEEVT